MLEVHSCGNSVPCNSLRLPHQQKGRKKRQRAQCPQGALRWAWSWLQAQGIFALNRRQIERMLLLSVRIFRGTENTQVVFKIFLNAACFRSQQWVFAIFRFHSRPSFFIFCFCFSFPLTFFHSYKTQPWMKTCWTAYTPLEFFAEAAQIHCAAGQGPSAHRSQFLNYEKSGSVHCRCRLHLTSFHSRLSLVRIKKRQREWKQDQKIKKTWSGMKMKNCKNSLLGPKTSSV